MIDGRLACADAFLAAGNRGSARAIYESLAARIGDTPTTHRDRVVRIAAKSGILACLDDTVAL